MSIIALLDQIGATDCLSLSKEGTDLTILVTKPRSGPARKWIRRAIGIASIGFAFFLLDPYLKGLPETTAPILALVFSVWLIVYDAVMERYREDFLEEIFVRKDGISLASSDFHQATTSLDIDPVRITVTTTLPVIRGAIEFRERESEKVLSLCEHTPYYQRYFVAKKISEHLELEMTADRKPSPTEAELIRNLETQWLK